MCTHGKVRQPLRPGPQLPKQFKPLRAYEEERRRGVAHTPEYDEQMRVLKEEFQRWLLSE